VAVELLAQAGSILSRGAHRVACVAKLGCLHGAALRKIS
jgi:hypothetical protein